MAIENSTRCDACGDRMGEGDDVYCYKCHDELQDKVGSLKEKIDRLENKIAELQIELQEEKK